METSRDFAGDERTDDANATAPSTTDDEPDQATRPGPGRAGAVSALPSAEARAWPPRAHAILVPRGNRVPVTTLAGHADPSINER